MRYDESTARLVIGEGELAGAVAALGLAPGPLASAQLVASEEARTAFEDALITLSDDGRELLQETMGRLADPSRTVDLAAIGADESVSRAVFAWGRDDEVALLAGAGDAIQLGMVSADDVLAQVVGPLRIDGEIVGADQRIELDARAVMALVAAGDALRAARIHALTTHAETPDAVTAADAAAMLAESGWGDPRWASGLFAGVLPFEAATFMDAPTIDLAFSRLVDAGVLAITEAEAGMPAIYRPTEDGWGFFDTLLQADARVAVTVYEKSGDEVTYESMLLARGAGTVLLFHVAPGGGGAGTLTAQGLAQVAGAIART